jgi:uncharacterized membrane protein YraQ (UPF0718 family)
MMSTIIAITTDAVFNSVQLLAGCILAIPLLRFASGRLTRLGNGPGTVLASLLLFSVCGSLLPLGVFGIAPLFGALLAAGLPLPAALSFLCSNLLFNMLVPLRDPSFIWKTGYGRPILAIAAALLAGCLCLLARCRAEPIVRPRELTRAVDGTVDLGTSVRSVGRFFIRALPFVFLGTAADGVFRRFLLREVLQLLAENPATSPIFGFMSSRDVGSPFFLLAMRVLSGMIDLAKLSALAVILKLKGLLAYLGYFAGIAALLAVSAFL